MKKRTAYHHGDLKRALADAGVELLSEVGPSFTLRQAAARVGVSHGAAYRHFADRDALLAELARRGFIDLRERVAHAMRTASSPRGKLEMLLRAYLRFGWERSAQYEVMFGRRLNEAGRFGELEDAVQATVRLLQTTVAEYLEDDDRRRSRDVGIGVWSLAHGFTSNVLRRRIHVRSLGAAEEYIVLVAKPLLDGARGGA